MLLSVKVTSHPPRQGIEGEIPLLDWQAAGLSKPSTARCSKTILVPLSVFVGQRMRILKTREQGFSCT